MKRPDSSHPQFQQRIPADIRARVAGMKLSIPFGDGEFHHLTVSAEAEALRFSLRTRDPGMAEMRQASVLGYLESVWQGLRAKEPASLTQR